MVQLGIPPGGVHPIEDRARAHESRDSRSDHEAGEPGEPDAAIGQENTLHNALKPLFRIHSPISSPLNIRHLYKE
jgi:hypothetical protein